MSRQLVEELRGIGQIYSGKELLRTTRYELSVWREADVPADAGAPENVVIEGHIDITGIAEAVVLAGPETLTLILEDGRAFPFTLTSSVGSVIGRSGFRSAAG